MIWKSTTVTHVAMIVDCSGSMMGRSADLWNAAVDVLRSCKHDGDIVLHPIWFANRIRADKPIHLNDAPRMTDHMILNMPIGGMTALVGGMLTAWEQMRGYECRAGNVAMLGLVLTDGKDNASKRSVSELAPIMERTQASGQWTWCYMGTRYDGRAKVT
jgi:Mg-chelatase subunit ChlD